MRNFLLLVFIIVGALLVLYLSWVSSPKIGGNQLIPSWMAKWVDAYRFNTIRTAVPMVFLGGLSGLIIQFNKLGRAWWWFSWIFLSLLIVLAEIGQMFRPFRTFDLKDIFWGSVGAALGLLTIVMFTILIKSIKNNI